MNGTMQDELRIRRIYSGPEYDARPEPEAPEAIKDRHRKTVLTRSSFGDAQTALAGQPQRRTHQMD